MNEYVIYWRKEILFRSKVICDTKEEANAILIDRTKTDYCFDDIDEEGNDEIVATIDSSEMLEENVNA